jgi:hypothetical protein
MERTFAGDVDVPCGDGQVLVRIASSHKSRFQILP